ncbi:HD domain-containing phosphohydrolase [Sulfurimonas sp.]|jgi:putative two-component system response regulator|uniref:HD domain-containing phosphohydrolase n=1 Tax=Sulfurimonas sp. TaxID=2022749 RepID=UPI0025ECAB37|nr:HD domain-containing phosphohydrolase [Sulfurimonas sp.]MCK9472494.1 response regulator [Sulfurimonas sp.]MDD3505402.1 response regulator [Sulfurimonas sp.]
MNTILLCDDELMNRKVASKILNKEGFNVIEAQNGKEAIEVLNRQKVDLILMDLMMPVMDGYEATAIIKSDDRFSTIPLIIISALSDKEAINKGLKLGADEYLTKPYDIIEFGLRVKNAIKLGAYQNMLKEHKKILEQEVAKKTKELQDALIEIQKSEQDIISILGKTAEYRDNETSVHTLRVGEMAALIARKIGWSSDDVELIRLASPMHDLGKVGIADNILLKPGKLDEEEFEIMKQHSTIGYSILSQKETPLLKLAAEIANTHHEKYNGKGYPNGLIGDNIPLSGAIVAVVDVFDALLSERPYKRAFTLETALEIIKNDSGTHFNPKVVELFMDSLDEIIAIRTKLQDV